MGATTSLTALLAVGGLLGFGLAAWGLKRGFAPYLLSAIGLLAGIVAFSAVIFAQPFASATLFSLGTLLIGLGAALFSVGTLMATMGQARDGQVGLAIGAWGAAEASSAGIAIASGGILRDVIGYFAESGALGEVMNSPVTGYACVYNLELLMLFATLVALGPLVRRRMPTSSSAVAPPLSLVRT